MHYTDYTMLVGKRVCKLNSNKPFKSGEKINTVKSIVNHPVLDIPAFTFIEDDSYVECRRCYAVKSLMGRLAEWLLQQLGKLWLT